MTFGENFEEKGG